MKEELLRVTNLLIEAEANKDIDKIKRIREAILNKEGVNVITDILKTEDWSNVQFLISELQKHIDSISNENVSK